MKTLINQRFGKLVVLSDPYYKTNRSGRKVAYCLARCDCGSEKETQLYKLTQKHQPSRSCGCQQPTATAKANRVHGGSGTRLYAIWKGIRSRCYNPNRQGYRDYGAKGVRMCRAWKVSFAAFRDWALASGYGPDLWIHREGDSGNYSPENCRWITKSESSAIRNRNQSVASKSEHLH